MRYIHIHTFQDKVVEFAKLDCYEMLEETEKAVSVCANSGYLL